jgi:peptide deformylase
MHDFGILLLGDQMIRPIVIFPNKVLSTPCQPVEHFDQSLENLIGDLWDTLRASKDGCGLAAPQIGVPLQVAIVDTRDFDDEVVGQSYVLINPEVMPVGYKVESDEEGCLSMPGVFLDVVRPAKIACRFVGEDKRVHGIIAEGLTARAIQHEVDHLSGVMFTKRATRTLR